MLWLGCRLDKRKTSSTPSTSIFLSSPLPDRLWSLASLLSSGYRESWRSVSARAGSWLLTSDQYFRVLLNRHKEHVTFTVYTGLPFYAFVARIACDEHDVSYAAFFSSSQLLYGFRWSFVLRVCDKKWQNLLLARICLGNPRFFIE